MTPNKDSTLKYMTRVMWKSWDFYYNVFFIIWRLKIFPVSSFIILSNFLLSFMIFILHPILIFFSFFSSSSFLFSFLRSLFYLIALWHSTFSDTLNTFTHDSAHSLFSVGASFVILVPRLVLARAFLPPPPQLSIDALALWDFHDRHHPRNATGIARESEKRVGDTRNNFPSSFSCSTWI